MIGSFQHKGLEAYWVTGKSKAIRPDWRKKVLKILQTLDAAESTAAFVPGMLGFHPLTGDQDGRFAMDVSRNWRISFGWSDVYAVEIDLEDYH